MINNYRPEYNKQGYLNRTSALRTDTVFNFPISLPISSLKYSSRGSITSFVYPLPIAFENATVQILTHSKSNKVREHRKQIKNLPVSQSIVEPVSTETGDNCNHHFPLITKVTPKRHLLLFRNAN
ncbi:hypothetical protein CDAR_163951 [Caerostris darwini]|uniref:Uncharacterized protein n=1 Tax=Caerostris darwini TaxID=1538125 RepID=A0AAV4UVS3_9ARAC|nr:hypothetical protein CDAR_163951 [Caerostris darwini]